MAATFTPDYETEIPTTSGRRRKITKFALAGVAVLGVGAALTSAAWSDNVFFNTPANTAEFELEGYNPTTGDWEAADGDGAAIALPADAINDVGPGIADTYTVTVRNAGTVDIQLTQAVEFAATGALFAGLEPAEVTIEDVAGTVLIPGAQYDIDVTVEGPTTWDDSDYLGATGNVIIQVQGESIAD